MKGAATNKSAKRVGLAVRVDLDATGEELVSISVRDTADELPGENELGGTAPTSGLGLVAAAVRRYGGTIEAVRCGNGYSKEVVVRFFKAF